MSSFMSLEISCTLLVVLVVMLWLCWVRRRRSSKAKRIPPGSLGWPFLGESMEFMASYRSNDPDSFLESRRARYGRVFTTHLFGKPTIISVDPEVNRFILHSEGKLFTPDYPKSLNDLWGKWAILRLEGGLHKKIHGLIGTFLKSTELKETLIDAMETQVRATMSSWGGRKVYVEDEAKKIGFQVTAKALLSLAPGHRTDFLREEFHKYIEGIISLPIRLPGTTFSRSLQAKEKLVKIVKEIVEERGSQRTCCRDRDMLDVLLAERDENGEGYPLELITDNIVTFFFPAEDSVAMLMTLAVKLLTECPMALQHLREENLQLKSRRKGQKLNWSDYLSLPFTQKVLNETLRVGNIVKGVIRKATSDVQIKDFIIPKGWAVFPFFRGVHLDSNLYSDPHIFNPWRWQGKVSSINFTPFGGGPRYCAGLELARLEAIVFLHHLVTEFRWKAEPDRVINFPFVSCTNRLPIWVEKL